MRTVELYTDGACKDNQSKDNVGGYGGVLHFRGHEKEFSGGVKNSTNNIMELTAVIEGLKAIHDRDLRVEIYTDSAYIVNCFKEKWYVDWIKRGWKTSARKPVENRALWEELLALVDEFAEVVFYKIKGHLLPGAKDYDKWYNKFRQEEKEVSLEVFKRYISYNHRADELASDAALKAGEYDKE